MQTHTFKPGVLQLNIYYFISPHSQSLVFTDICDVFFPTLAGVSVTLFLCSFLSIATEKDEGNATV